MNDLLQALKDKPLSLHVLIAYNGKIVDMGYITPEVKPDAKKLTKAQKEKQFKFAAMRVCDNSSEVGFIRLPDSTIYQVSRDNRSAKLVNE